MLIPGHLLLGIDTGVFLDALYSHWELPVTIEYMEEFLVTNGVEGIEVAQRIDPFGFFEKAVLHHLVNTTVDAVEEVLTLATKTNFDELGVES